MIGRLLLLALLPAFDTGHLRRLCDTGRRLARSGDAWRDGVRVGSAP
ncbi:hypothetical protein [Roseococcus sp. SYP-B2431]|nr:hypothetical protein [Roseococcus sp. SYP-B2431]